MYVLGVLLFVVDYALVRQALECDDQALPDEPQVVPRPRRRMRQSTLRAVLPTIIAIYSFKVAFLLTCLLVHLKLDGVLGDSASSWAWVFVPYYLMVVTSYVVTFRQAKREKPVLVVVTSIVALFALVCGLLFNLYAVGIITVFACVLIPFYILAAFLLIPTCCLMCD